MGERVPATELIFVIDGEAVEDVSDDNPFVAGLDKSDSEIEGLDDMSNAEAASDICIEETVAPNLSD